MAKLFWICVFLLCCVTVRGADWTYTDQDAWLTQYKGKCDGVRQSPINLVGAEFSNLGTINTATYSNTPSKQKVTNDGHTLKISFEDNFPQIYGGGLPSPEGGKYQFLQYHYHWGMDTTEGSEHQINGQKFPLEVHFVHWNVGYKTVDIALTESDGIAVLGVMFQISATDNPILTNIIDSISSVTAKDAFVERTDLPTLSQLLPSNTNDFYRYLGSLTTPTCNQVVVWTVFKEPVDISASQLAKFRTLLGEDGNALQTTFRNLIQEDNRVIKQTFPTTTNTGGGSFPILKPVCTRYYKVVNGPLCIGRPLDVLWFLPKSTGQGRSESWRTNNSPRPESQRES